MTDGTPEAHDGPGQEPARDAVAGAALESLLRETARGELAVVAPTPATSPTTFVDAVMQFLTRRHVESAAAATADVGPSAAPTAVPPGVVGGDPARADAAVAVFVQVPSSREFGEARQLARRHGFRESSALPLAGRLFVASAQLGGVYEGVLDASDLDGAFQAVANAGLGAAPAVFVDLRARAVVWCPGGIEADEHTARMPIVTAPHAVTHDDVEAMLADFHRVYTERPHGYAKVWHDKDAFVPRRDAEKAVQQLLLPYARNRYLATHIVREEDDAVTGRADIVISTRDDQPHRLGSAVLELKVLREKHFPNKDAKEASACPPSVNREAVLKGLDQALTYRKDLGSDLAFLCCYDMRRDDDQDAIFAEFTSDAATRSVVLKRYYLFNSSDAQRTAADDSFARAAAERAADAKNGRGRAAGKTARKEGRRAGG